MGNRPGACVGYGVFLGYNDSYGSKDVDDETIYDYEKELERLFGCTIEMSGWRGSGDGGYFLLIEESLHRAYCDVIDIDQRKLTKQLSWDLKLKEALKLIAGSLKAFEDSEPGFMLIPYYG